MKKTLPFLLLFLAGICNAFAAKDIEVSDTFVLLGSSFTYRYVSASESSNSIQFTRNSDNKTTTELLFESFTIEVFKEIFHDSVPGLIPGYDPATQYNDVENKASEIFYGIKARKEFLDDEPVTSTILVKSDTINSLLSLNGSLHYQGPLTGLLVAHKLKDFEIEFEQGTIKNVTLRLVDLTNPNLRNYLIFTNRFPFTISAKFDNESLANMRLYCNNCGGVDNVTRFVTLGSFLILDNKYDNYKEDYSPVDGVTILNPQHPVKELRKEKRSQILEVAGFTDFMGVDEKNPNGLLQIEVSRKINLWNQHFSGATKKKDISSYLDFGKVYPAMPLIKKISEKEGLYKITFLSATELRKAQTKDTINSSARKFLKKDTSSLSPKQWTQLAKDRRYDFDMLIKDNVDSNIKSMDDMPKRQRANLQAYFDRTDSISGVYYIKTQNFSKVYSNFFGSLETKFRFSKIEDNQKNLSYTPDTSAGNPDTLNPLNFYRYQKMSFGVDLNVIKINFTNLKFAINLNMGVNWYKTGLANQASEESRSVDGFTYTLSSGIRFFPDGRWGAGVGYDYLHNTLLGEDFTLAKNRGLFQYKFDGYLKTNATDKVFFRYRLTHQSGNRNNVFAQVQLGYSMDIFSVKSK
ncbi:hypothetical protein SAMN04487996_12515 [Dyadobacter soli]|uniref:Outer membrane protein beta-barrel family protein n=1 Tax=Dyadobacter soli TaxID=659014 RepID=A0A1G7Y1I8_9BACT|nr:hypothetical protein [Dyadobacter soli]SDG89800.1 hypothetical protein SAMN04487996_12515 [Dyadobacter soli]